MLFPDSLVFHIGGLQDGKGVWGLDEAPGRPIRLPLPASEAGDGVVGVSGTVGKDSGDAWDSG